MTETSKKAPVAAIAGGVVGGLFAVAVIAGLLTYYCYHAKKSRAGNEGIGENRQYTTPGMDMYQNEAGGARPQVDPPGYVSPKPKYLHRSHVGHHYTQQPYYNPTPEPQELPVEPTHFVIKSGTAHKRNVSELSGDSTRRSELESPQLLHFASLPSSPHGSMPDGWQSPPGARTVKSVVARSD
ncbi:hypothetical protein ACEQ8H_002561 [Pleosporales sp. CAS-2024a]